MQSIGHKSRQDQRCKTNAQDYTKPYVKQLHVKIVFQNKAKNTQV